MLNIVLVEPEIPPNTGNIGRLCLATGARLHLVKPLGFSLDDRAVRRAGLDYWREVDVTLWDSLDEIFAAAPPGRRFHFLTTRPCDRIGMRVLRAAISSCLAARRKGSRKRSSLRGAMSASRFRCPAARAR